MRLPALNLFNGPLLLWPVHTQRFVQSLHNHRKRMATNCILQFIQLAFSNKSNKSHLNSATCCSMKHIAYIPNGTLFFLQCTTFYQGPQSSSQKWCTTKQCHLGCRHIIRVTHVLYVYSYVDSCIPNGTIESIVKLQ